MSDTPMNEQAREQISALMDDELDNGSAFVLNGLQDSPELRQIWQRYHLMGDCLRGHLPAQIDLKLADRISLALRNEPALNNLPHASPQYLKPVIGFAIAASVTFVAIMGVRQTGIEPVASPVPAVASVQPVITNHPAATVVATHPVIQEQHEPLAMPVDAESRLNRYLVNYNEYRSNSGMQGMLPYVRIVAHEVEE